MADSSPHSTLTDPRERIANMRKWNEANVGDYWKREADFWEGLLEQLETQQKVIAAARSCRLWRIIRREDVEALDAAFAELDAGSSPASNPLPPFFGVPRCPVCEGLDQPGLMHNPDAPYCSQAPDPANRPDASESPFPKPKMQQIGESLPASDPFDGIPGTPSAAGGSWGPSGGGSYQESKP